VLPVVKIASNSRTASLLAEHIDVDAGPISTGDATIDGIGREIFETILAVATGQRVAAEIGRHREFAIPRLWSSF
jgi:altronate dehydratase large subunit